MLPEPKTQSANWAAHTTNQFKKTALQHGQIEKVRKLIISDMKNQYSAFGISQVYPTLHMSGLRPWDDSSLYVWPLGSSGKGCSLHRVIHPLEIEAWTCEAIAWVFPSSRLVFVLQWHFAEKCCTAHLKFDRDSLISHALSTKGVCASRLSTLAAWFWCRNAVATVEWKTGKIQNGFGDAVCVVRRLSFDVFCRCCKGGFQCLAISDLFFPFSQFACPA